MVAFAKNIQKRNVMVLVDSFNGEFDVSVTTVEVVLNLNSCVFLSNQVKISLFRCSRIFDITLVTILSFMNLWEVSVSKRFCLI